MRVDVKVSIDGAFIDAGIGTPTMYVVDGSKRARGARGTRAETG